MATFTDWMRLGEARMTSLATLALGAGMALLAPESADAAHPTTGERTVSGVRISLGEEGREWTFVPTLLDGKVESFLALREDMPMGENLTAVWYRKVAAADGTESWETKAFEDQDQSKAIRAVKQALALADSTDESWPVAVAAVAAAAPEPMIKGVLESDALAPLVADLEDPRPIVEMLEDAGWKAAWIGPLEGVTPGLDPSTVEPETGGCPQAVVLDALATTVEVVAVGGVEAGVASLQSMMALCGSWCIPTAVETVGGWFPWNCATAQYEFVECNRAPHAGCAHLCIYRKRFQRVRYKSVGRVLSDCSTHTISYSQTEHYDSMGSCLRYGFLPPGCNMPVVSGSGCPTGAACKPFGSPGAGDCASDALVCPPSPGEDTTITDWE